jgi:hypothetical protein
VNVFVKLLYPLLLALTEIVAVPGLIPLTSPVLLFTVATSVLFDL